jgi:thiol-disulfide isomerase/thioredoxin
VANTSKLMQAQNANDTATVKSLRLQYESLQKEMEAATFKYIEEHPKSFIAALLIQNMFNMLEPPIEKIEKFYNNLDPELKNNKVGKKILKNITEFKVVAVGKYAPDFTAPNPDGKATSLKNTMGKMTIIDFWASWCGPCRKANPELVALYNEYASKGLKIISVSLDKPGQADRWKEAIAKDGMGAWTHVSNLKEWSDPIAKQYGVESIPALFVLNEFGVVVAKDLHGAKLRDKVSQFLDKK